jgi:hypothetical protein
MTIVSMDQYMRRTGSSAPQGPSFQARLPWDMVAAALDSPLAMPGSIGVAERVISELQPEERAFASAQFPEKILERPNKGRSRDTTALSRSSFMVSLVAWNRTHREMPPPRMGRILGQAKKLAAGWPSAAGGWGVSFEGLLDVDPHVRENHDVENPGRVLDDTFQVDVEYSYVPGDFFGISLTSLTYLSRDDLDPCIRICTCSTAGLCGGLGPP